MADDDLGKVFYLYFERVGILGCWRHEEGDGHIPVHVLWNSKGNITPTHLFLGENTYTIRKDGIIMQYAMGTRKEDGSGRRYFVRASCPELRDYRREFALMLEEGGPLVGKWFYEDADVVHGRKVRFEDIPPSGYSPQLIYESMGVSQMCARFQITIPIAEFLREWNDEHGVWLSQEAFEKKIKRGIIKPTDYSAVMLNGDGEVETDAMKWGLKRSWADGPIFNLRCDSLETKAWVQEIKGNRCVIPCAGFYESHKQDGKLLDRYYFQDESQKTLYLAGVYDSGTEEEPPRFTILTTDANRYVGIHDRMPAVLRSGECKAWLDGRLGVQQIMNRSMIVLQREKEAG